MHIFTTLAMFSSWWIPQAWIAAAATPRAVDAAPAQRFATDVSDRHGAGAHLRMVDVVDDGAELSVELTLVDAAGAERFVLLFDRDGERAMAYRHGAVPVPTGKRVYRFESELFEILERGAVAHLIGECQGYFLEGRAGGVSIDPDDYFEVIAVARGRDARRFVARVLADDLEDGVELAGVLAAADVPTGAVSAIDLLLFDGREEVLHVGLDGQSRVVAAELRWSPAAYASWAKSYPNGAALAEALRRARFVDRLDLEVPADGEPRLRFGLPGAASYLLDTATFALAEDSEDVGCGC
jgi:hypothetical protein